MQKNNRKKFVVGLLALTIALMMSAVVGFSQGQQDGRGKGHGRHDGMGRFARNLNLTDAQKAQMDQISARYKESTKGLREQLRNLHHNSEKASEGSFNEAAVRQAAQARANIMVELEVARARMKSEMFAVLTAEQKAQLEQQRQERRERRGQRKNNRGGSDLEIQQQ